MPHLLLVSSAFLNGNFLSKAIDKNCFSNYMRFKKSQLYRNIEAIDAIA